MYLAGPVVALLAPSIVCGAMYACRKLVAAAAGNSDSVELKTYLVYTRTAFILLVFLIYNKVCGAAVSESSILLHVTAHSVDFFLIVWACSVFSCRQLTAMLFSVFSIYGQRISTSDGNEDWYLQRDLSQSAYSPTHLIVIAVGAAYFPRKHFSSAAGAKPPCT